jgi:hypothetical protein
MIDWLRRFALELLVAFVTVVVAYLLESDTARVIALGTGLSFVLLVIGGSSILRKYRFRWPLRSPVIKRGMPPDRPSRRDREAAGRLRPQLLILWRSALEDAANSANQTLRMLMDEMRVERTQPQIQFLGLIQHAIVDEERRAFSTLSNALTLPGSAGYNDPKRLQQIAGDWWYRYQGVSAYVETLWGLSMQRGNETRVLRSWLKKDMQFLGEMKALVARDEFAELRAEVERVGFGEGLSIRQL